MINVSAIIQIAILYAVIYAILKAAKGSRFGQALTGVGILAAAMFAGLKVMQDLPENPWIALRTARDHKSITSGLLLHCDHIFRCQQVSVADHRY